ncbi:MAG: leucyl/phenylalanyl-tRNA--protein transferase [Spirochaetia bacterium]
MQFPYLPADVDFDFPSPTQSKDVVAIGGNLSPGMLLSAYRRGIFPWYNDDEGPIVWQSLDPRCILYPQNLHISKKFSRFAKKQNWRLYLDRDFTSVIQACASQPRTGQDGTWITKNMQQAYLELHKLGFAHSCEVYDENDIFIGGLYGVLLGAVFFGESMVSLVCGASRYAFIHFVCYFERRGLLLIDCQQATDYLMSMGACIIHRDEFLQELQSFIQKKEITENWVTKFADFQDFSPFF